MQFALLLKLLPDVIDKDRVIEQSQIVRKELEDSTLKVYKSAVGVFDELHSKDAQTIESVFQKTTGVKGSVIDTVYDRLQSVEKNLSTAEDFIIKNFPKEILKAQATVRELNLIQFIGSAQFVSSFARRLLFLYYAYESDEFKENSLKFNESVSKAELRYVTDNYLDFITALEALSSNDHDFEQVLKNLPEINIDSSNVKTIASIHSSSKIDPLKMQFFNVANSFLYKLQLIWAERQADSYKLALEERKVLEYRNLLLKKQREGSSDARLEREISLTEDRIAKLTYKIRKMEE